MGWVGEWFFSYWLIWVVPDKRCVCVCVCVRACVRACVDWDVIQFKVQFTSPNTGGFMSLLLYSKAKPTLPIFLHSISIPAKCCWVKPHRFSNTYFVGSFLLISLQPFFAYFSALHHLQTLNSQLALCWYSFVTRLSEFMKNKLQ